MFEQLESVKRKKTLENTMCELMRMYREISSLIRTLESLMMKGYVNYLFEDRNEAQSTILYVINQCAPKVKRIVRQWDTVMKDIDRLEREKTNAD